MSGEDCGYALGSEYPPAGKKVRSLVGYCERDRTDGWVWLRWDSKKEKEKWENE